MHIVKRTDILQEKKLKMNGELRVLRESKALSRKDLAELASVHECTIYRAENGETRLRPSTVRKLALALKIDPEKITSGQGSFNI